MLLCRAVITGLDGDLAFLFNVLSVATFSVQEHPDREVLHAMRLGMYCNADHMAKMVVAVNELRALCSSLNPGLWTLLTSWERNIIDVYGIVELTPMTYQFN